MPFRCLIVSIVTLASVTFVHGQAPSTPKQPPSFRSRITMIPIDVRVVDRDGRPITDLTRDDFTITEDGVPQTIAHFSSQALTADLRAMGAADRPLELLKPQGASLAAPNRRVFLLLFGRGRLQGPSKEMPAVIDFVRKKLLPQDHVAVVAYNRATDFTNDHRQILHVLEQLEARQAGIEGKLEFHFHGESLSTRYGSKAIPPHIQEEIDLVFEGATGLRPREITAGQNTGEARLRDDIRRIEDQIEEGSSTMDVSLGEYLSSQVYTRQDLGNVYSAINYLRYIDGEKHLVFVTPRGLSLPRAENDRDIARVASDARIAISVLYTGGTVGAAPARYMGPVWNRTLRMSPLPTADAVFAQTFMVQAARAVADETGGQVAAFQYADDAFRRIDRATRFQYLLGYAPANTTMDGKYRRVSVKVNRRGARVLYRHGYFASDRLVPLDRQSFVTHGRIWSAAQHDGVINDITVTMNSPVISGEGPSQEILVTGTVHSPRIRFTEVDGRHVASLDLVVYCGDARERPVGEARKIVELKLSDDTYQAFLREGASFGVRVPLSGTPRHVKVVVYDYGADVLGTATATLQK